MSNLQNNSSLIKDLTDIISELPAKIVDTSDATAMTQHILSGEIAYVNGDKIIGSMHNNGAISYSMDGIATKSVAIPNGYTSGGTVKLDNTIDTEVDIQANLIAYITRVLESKTGSFRLKGISAVSAGSFILEEDSVGAYYYCSHDLGHVPNFFIVFTDEGYEANEFNNYIIAYMHMHLPYKSNNKQYQGVAFSFYGKENDFVAATTNLTAVSCTENKLYIYLNTRKLKANTKYRWVCGALIDDTPEGGGID